MNEYYTPSGSPTTNSDGSSAVMRAEFASIQTGLDKLPVLAANGDKAVFVNAGGTALTAVTAATARTNIGAQASDATLTSLSALGTAADKVAYTTGVDTWAETSLTAAGRALIDDASAAAQRTTLGSTTVGDAVFIAASTAAARTAIEAAGTGVVNTFVDGQIISSSDAGAGEVAGLRLNRLSASPAAGDLGVSIRLGFNNSAASYIDHTGFRGLLVDPTAGSEDTGINVIGLNGGVPVIVATIALGLQIGAPTGGDKGAGTLNATNLYVNNSAVLKQADIFVSADQTITLAGALTLAHGLGAEPRITGVRLVCQTAELGYSIGDTVQVEGDIASNVPDATNLNIRYRSVAASICHKTTGVLTAITAANWKARFYAIK